MRKANLFTLIIVLMAYGLAAIFYPRLPEIIASHWGLNNQVNGYMSKFWGTLIIPVMMTFLYLLFLVIPKTDPHKENYKGFQNYFDGFVILLELFLLYTYLLMLFWNVGYQFSFSLVLPPALGALFYYIGVLLSHAKQNWFIGIRTPWTLSNEKVWKQTHELGAKLFKVIGVLAVLTIFLPNTSFALVIGLLVGASLFLVFYSYYLYQNA